MVGRLHILGSLARRECAFRGVLLLLVVALLVVPGGVAGAQEHAETPDATDEAVAAGHVEDEHAAEEHAGPSWTEYTYKWINFVLLLLVMYKLLVVPLAFVVDNFEFEGLKVLLAARSGAIVSARDLAKDQQLAAETTQAESVARLDKVDDEVAALLADAKTSARAERERIEASAALEAEQLRAGADRDMNSQVVRARRDLRRHVADLSVSIATELVKETFSGGDQERLMRRYLDHLGETVA